MYEYLTLVQIDLSANRLAVVRHIKCMDTNIHTIHKTGDVVL